MNESLFLLAEEFTYCLLIILGLSCCIQTKFWMRTMNRIYSANKENAEYVCVGLGFVLLPLGLFIVLTHNEWDFTDLSVIVTLIGWGLLIKSVLYLLWPQWIRKFEFLCKRGAGFLTLYFRTIGAVYIILGLLVLYNFWNF